MLYFCSPVYGSKFEAESFLGGVERDSNGNILSATATTMSFFLDISGEDVFDIPDVRRNPGLQRIYRYITLCCNSATRSQSSPIMKFEQEYLEVGERGESGVTVFYFSGRRCDSLQLHIFRLIHFSCFQLR